MDSLPMSLTPPVYPRRRQQLIATAIGGAALALIIVSLVGKDAGVRAGLVDAGTWDLYIPLTQPNVMMATLVLASIAAQWASYSIAHDQRHHTFWAIGITLVLGLAFLNQSWFLISLVGLENGVDPVASSFYAVAGAITALVAGAVLYTLLMGFRALGGNFNSRYPEGLAASAMFWHITTGAYALVWYAVYITK